MAPNANHDQGRVVGIGHGPGQPAARSSVPRRFQLASAVARWPGKVDVVRARKVEATEIVDSGWHYSRLAMKRAHSRRPASVARDDQHRGRPAVKLLS